MHTPLLVSRTGQLTAAQANLRQVERQLAEQGLNAAVDLVRRRATLATEIAALETQITHLRTLGGQTLLDAELSHRNAMQSLAAEEARINAPGLSPSQRAALRNGTTYRNAQQVARDATRSLDLAYNTIDQAAANIPALRRLLNGSTEWVVSDPVVARRELARLEVEYTRLSGRTIQVRPRPAGTLRDCGIEIETGQIFIYDDVAEAFRRGYLAEELHHYFQLRERNLLGVSNISQTVEREIEHEVIQRVRNSGFIPYDHRNYAPYTEIPPPPGLHRRTN